MIAIVISKSDIEDSFGPRRIDPRLQKRPSVALDPVALWMTVVIDLFAWIDREIGDLLGESAVLGPSSQDLAGRIKQMNIDSLRGWEIKRNRRSANIPQYRLDP